MNASSSVSFPIDGLYQKLDEIQGLRSTGKFNDLEEPSADCELCDHPEIRYQFEIQNLHTFETLLVGSECIHRFGVAATDEQGHAMGASDTRKKVEQDRRKLVTAARKRRVVNALVALAHIDTEFKIESFIGYLQNRGAFTPKQLALIRWRLIKHGIRHNPNDFKLTIRRGREREQLLQLKDWQYKLLKPSLTATQERFIRRTQEVGPEETESS